MALLCILFIATFTQAATPPILNRSLASQLVPTNPTISSAFLIPSSSALISNLSITSPALRVPPLWSFSIGFSGATFLPHPDDIHRLSFSAQLDTGDSLPDWLHFAEDTITFGGVAPKQSLDIQVFNVVVSASSSSSSITSDTFTLIVASHDLSLTGPLLTRNVTADNKFSLMLNDWQGVRVDGASVTGSSLSIPSNNTGDVDQAGVLGVDGTSPPLSLALNTLSFSWLAYDPSSRTLSGTPPSSLVHAPGPVIPALVTLSYLPRPLSLSTNLTLTVLPSTFTTQTLPSITVTPGSNVSFALAPYLSMSTRTRVTVTALWDTQNATWLSFDPVARQISGTVPGNSVSEIKVAFVARDGLSGTVSRANMIIDIDSVRNPTIRAPTDRALRKTGKKVSVAVGIVFGIIASIILLASFLAICRRCCAAHEHVDGAYVIDQSVFDDGLKSSSAYKSSIEKDGGSTNASGVDAVYLEASRPPPALYAGTHTDPVRTITKGAFFSAVRERFGSDGSWRGRRGANGNGNGTGSERRARKSKISKPMALLSSSTSVRDGFGDRGRRGLSDAIGDNFTLFGKGNNAAHPHNANGRVAISPTSNPSNRMITPPPQRPPRAELSLSHVVVRGPPSARSSAGTAILAYDRARSNSDPSSRNSVSVNSSSVPGGIKSGSAPSLGVGSMGTQTGTGSGTQSTFATGDSPRLTNAVGEVPFRRPGFDGRFETLAERSMRETGNLGPNGSPGPIVPARAMVNTRTKAVESSTAPQPSSKVSSPAKTSPPKVPSQSVSNVSSKSSKPLGSDTMSETSSPPKPGSSSSARSNVPLTTTQTALSKPISAASLSAPSSYRNVFFGGEDNESDSSADDTEFAVIRQAVSRSSSGKREKQPSSTRAHVTKVPTGKPRLVQFTQAKTPAASGQAQNRDVSQKAMVKAVEDSDPEAEMRIGLEYVRQLGHSPPDSSHVVSRTHDAASASHLSSASDPTRTPSAEFYASNDSNGSIAGRSRVLAPLVINSHRGRHQAAYSMETATHDSFVSAVEREADVEHGSRWAVEAGLPRHTVYATCPFSFPADLHPASKHASALAASALVAKQADGRALPDWLRFDPSERGFWGVGPKATKGEKGQTLIMRVIVKVWQVEKDEIVGGFVFHVLAEKV